MPKPLSLALAALALGGSTAMTSAQEYCVSCRGPDVTYRCIIGGEPSAAARSSRGQLLCIKELARSGPHASCSVRRQAEELCEGEVRTVMFPAATDVAAPPVTDVLPGFTDPAGAIAPLPGGPEMEETEAAPEGPPDTLQEVAKDTGKNLKKAGEAVTDTAKNAGNAVGNALKNTWGCLSSLFTDC